MNLKKLSFGSNGTPLLNGQPIPARVLDYKLEVPAELVGTDEAYLTVKLLVERPGSREDE